MKNKKASEWKAYAAECCAALEDIAEALDLPPGQTPANVVEAVRSIVQVPWDDGGDPGVHDADMPNDQAHP